MTASHQKNLVLAETVAAAASHMGIENRVLDLTSLEIGLYSSRQHETGPGQDFAQLQSAMTAADGLWVCAAEYNGGVPPTLGSAIAWLSTECDDFREMFTGLPVALSTHSGGGGQKVLTTMRTQFAHLGSTVLGRELASSDWKEANPDSIAAMLTALRKLMN
ncbi:MAG: NAD(P)H-dependent oxidoreductase [Planctomycetaceae bacterium]|nr:NAD(P)H-dependent oxidoreductase [Planctomycetaceae bacterium]